jgi:hypothetical protein
MTFWPPNLVAYFLKQDKVEFNNITSYNLSMFQMKGLYIKQITITNEKKKKFLLFYFWFLEKRQIQPVFHVSWQNLAFTWTHFLWLKLKWQLLNVITDNAIIWFMWSLITSFNALKDVLGVSFYEPATYLGDNVIIWVMESLITSFKTLKDVFGGFLWTCHVSNFYVIMLLFG